MNLPTSFATRARIMADGLKVKLDMSEWDRVFTALDGPVKESLARRMLVEGGVLLRDKAKELAPRSDGPYTPSSRGSHASGTLASAIYLAQDTDETTPTKYVYKISWNDKIAWWGKLAEFGYWRKYIARRDNSGQFYSDTTQGELPEDKWVRVPPHSFLRPANTSYGAAAIKAMIERGRREFPSLMAEIRQ
jgi:hypothetical protein